MIQLPSNDLLSHLIRNYIACIVLTRRLGGRAHLICDWQGSASAHSQNGTAATCNRRCKLKPTTRLGLSFCCSDHCYCRMSPGIFFSASKGMNRNTTLYYNLGPSCPLSPSPLLLPPLLLLPRPLTYGSVSAGREKWPFRVIFFQKVEPSCDQT